MEVEKPKSEAGTGNPAPRPSKKTKVSNPNAIMKKKLVSARKKKNGGIISKDRLKKKTGHVRHLPVPTGDAESVVYLGHIPHGFYEDEMRGFFSQFGAIDGLKLARSKTTGKSRGYGFIKFKYPEVAQVVAETMNNYLLRDKLLKCVVLPAGSVPLKMFADDRDKWVYKRKVALAKHDEPITEDDVCVRRIKSWKRLVAKKHELSKLGVDLKELDVLDATEKVGDVIPDEDDQEETEEAETEAGIDETTGKSKKLAKRLAREEMEKQQEEAVRVALTSVPACQTLMEQLAKLSKERFVVAEEDVDKLQVAGKSGVLADVDDLGLDSDLESDSDVDLDETARSGASDYKGDEVRLYGDSDSEIEFKTPPGMRKRKILPAMAVDSGDEREAADEGFEETSVKMKSAGKTPGRKGGSASKQAASKSSKLLNLQSASKTPGKKDNSAAKQAPRFLSTPEAATSTGKKKKGGPPGTSTPVQIITSASSRKKPEKVKSESKAATLKRLQKERRKSAPPGNALTTKKFANAAFLDRSLNRRRISKRADEMDDD